MAQFVGHLAAFFGTRSLLQIEWSEDGDVTLVRNLDGRPEVLRPLERNVHELPSLPLQDDEVQTVFNLGSLGGLDERRVLAWICELRRVVECTLWFVIPATPGRDRAWWEDRFFAAGFRKHPRMLEVLPFETLEDESDAITLVLEKIPATGLERYPLSALKAERSLHMDMTRETGRRSDAHIARYIMARRYLPEAGLVLDAACGLGYGSATLACTHPQVRVVGIDNSDYAAAYGRSCFQPTYPNLEFRTGDVCVLTPFADESVDLVVSFETVEHLRKPELFLAEVRRVLKPGGRFVCSVPNMWVDETGKDPNPWHFHVFDFEKLAALCSKFFPIEHIYRQTAGGGMKLNRAPRALELVAPPVIEQMHDAEWWLVAAEKPKVEVNTPDTILVLSDDTKHPLFSSWLGGATRPVQAAGRIDLSYEFPANTALVVASDCYHEPNVTLLRRAVEKNIPTLVLADGILEYRNTWEHPQLAPGAIFQPVLGHKIACLGASQVRVLESWGNAGTCELVGSPRFDRYAALKRRERPVGAPARLLVMTAMTPYFTESQHERVRQSLLDLKNALAEMCDSEGRPIETVWRVTKGLEHEIGIDTTNHGFAGRDLGEVLQAVDAVVTTPSTTMLEAMLLGLPVASLDYCNVPAYVQPAWRISAAEHILPTLEELLNPPPARMLFQDTTLHDALVCGSPAAPRMVELAEAMIAHAETSRRTGQACVFPTQMVQPVRDRHSAAEPRFQLASLYPGDAQFAERDLRALQVEVGHLRRYVAKLESLGSGKNQAKPVASGFEERGVRLITKLADSERGRARAEQIAVWEVTLAGQTCSALLLSPPVALEFKLAAVSGGRFSTAVALHPDVWENVGSGACEFSVRVNGRTAFAVALDPLRCLGDRRWHEIEFDLPDSSAGHHRITLETRGIGSNDFRWAIWREPRLSWYESIVPVEQPAAPELVGRIT